MSKRRLILLFVTLILCASLIAPAGAQEATAEPTAAVVQSASDAPENTPVAGAGTFILLMGLGAVVIVGGVAILRDNARRTK